jgi:hypothetical protein
VTADQAVLRRAIAEDYLALAPGHYWLRVAFVGLAIELAKAVGARAPSFPWVSS